MILYIKYIPGYTKYQDNDNQQSCESLRAFLNYVLSPFSINYPCKYTVWTMIHLQAYQVI